MNRINIGRRVYELGKIISSRMSEEDWYKQKQYLRRNDKAHVVRVGEDFFYVIAAKFDPKYKHVDLQYRPMTFIFVEPEEQTREAPDLSIRSVRGKESEL